MPQPTDEELLDRLQRSTLRYFWEFGHPASGMARERSNVHPGYGLETVTTGGTGFGIMAMIVGAERRWLERRDVVQRLLQITRFLRQADSFHGVFPHFLNGDTGRVIPFSPKDDGADLVETSFLVAGLLAARRYFSKADRAESELREAITEIWHAVDWRWHTRDDEPVLYWHWSPNHGWAMQHPIHGWNECLITYLLAASSPTHPIKAEAYHKGWAGSGAMRNGKRYGGIRLPLGPEKGGPLFFAHYSFMGLDPRGLRDRYADYWQQNRAHALINHLHCIDNPNGYAGYSACSWGLTAGDNDTGYSAHAPDNDLGIITPTAALASMPYTPDESLKALRWWDKELGDRFWGDLGPIDGFCLERGWFAQSHLAIDQGPIVVMVENHRTGLMWNIFMQVPEILGGLTRLGVNSPHLALAA